MSPLQENVQDFLAQKRIAVAGVSRQPNEAANLIYRKLRDSGYEVFAVNPKAEQVEGDPCYPDLHSLPLAVDGVVISTPVAASEDIVHECAEVGVNRVWMHRSLGEGSVSDEAVSYCRDHGISVIPGGCPMMFAEPVDWGHKCMRWLLKMTRGLP